MGIASELLALGPNIIGATGGSGTRVVARIVRHGGMFIGSHLNESEDALDVADYLDRWINPFMRREESPLSPQDQIAMIQELNAVLEHHLESLGGTDRPWGWKEPRSLYLLPFFHRQFPGLKFLHVVRDGRDMAFSSNQNQLRKHGSALLNPKEMEWVQPLRSIALWSRINLLTADYGEKNLGGAYLCIRFEDLCTKPFPTIGRIFDFFGLKGNIKQFSQIEVSPPESLGRWQGQDDKILVELHRMGGTALRRFGYHVPKYSQYPQPLRDPRAKVAKDPVKVTPSTQTSSQQIICVLGMHRSGTSLISRVLNLLGVYLGPEEHLMKPSVDNPKGYWEHQLLSDINDEILSRLGGSWHEPPTFAPGWLRAPELADLRRRARSLLHSDFGAAALWGWKDPRTCLTLPFWQNLVPSIKYVLCLRNPIDVARSLQSRDGFSVEKSISLWLTHVKSAIEHTSGQSRIFLFYEDLMAYPRAELRRVAGFLGREDAAENEEMQKALQDFVDEELQHHCDTLVDTIDDPHVAFAAKALYMALRLYRGLPRGEVKTDTYPDGMIQEALNGFSHYCAITDAEMTNLQARVVAMGQEHHELQSTLEGQQHALVKKENLLSELAADRDRLNQEIAQLQAGLETERGNSGKKDEQLVQFAADRDRLSQEIAQHQAALETERENSGRKDEQLVQFAADRGRLNQEIVGLQGALETERESSGRKDEELVQLAEERDRLFQENEIAIAAKDEQLAQVTADRDRLIEETTQLKTGLRARDDTIAARDREIYELAYSESYRFGLFCTWPLRKVWNIIRNVGSVRSLSLIAPHSVSVEPIQHGKLRHEPLNKPLIDGHVSSGCRSYAAWKIARYFYRKIPLSFRMKLKIRGLFFRYFGGLVTPTSLWNRVETRPLPAQMNSRPAHYETYVRAAAALDDEPAITREFQRAVDAYQAWVDVNIWNYRREERLRSRLWELDMPPLLSVIMPVYDPPLEWLNRAIETVRCQVYGNWELCIADDASTNGEVRTALIKWAENDERIKVCYRERNGNISAATNSAASLATGSHLVFLDQDDELTPDALGEIALYIAVHPEVDVVYSDDDKIDVEGRRFAPQFKPDWSPELLLSYMYFSHVFVVSRKLFEEVGGTRIGFEGSQDYDLALRVSEKARHVGHIPLVLYHWRVLPGSTASSGKAKPDSMEAGKKAVHEALQRRAMNAAAYQPDWALQLGVGIFSHRFSFSDQPRVTIIIPTKDQVDVLKRCISSILEKTDYQNYEILIIDNESAEQKTTRYLNKISKNNNLRTVRISNPEGRFSYAYINNRAVRSTSSEYVLFLNNDTEVLKKDWLTQMVGYARIPGVGAVGARLFYPDKRIQHAGVLIKFYHGLAGHAFKGISKQDPGYLGYAKALRNYSAVTAACLLTPKKLFLETGGFDDRNFSVAYNDVDYCGRLLEKGHRVVYTPEAELVHHEGFSRGFCDEPRENVNFKEKYYRGKDRYYSRSLSLDNEYFEVWPRAVFTGEFRKTVRVLMCAHNLNHEGAPYSQYEVTVGLKKKGVIEPVVFSPSDGPLRALYESQRIKVIVDEGLGAVFYPAAYRERVKAFAAFIKGLGVEVVYANTVINFHAIASAEKAGVPSLWNIRESEQWQYYESWWGAELAGEAARCFAYPYKVIFVAHTTKHVYRAFEWRHNFHVIYNGLNVDRIYGEAKRYDRKAVRKELGISDDELAVLLPGTICERKGQHDLVRTLALLRPECLGKIRCFIVGETESPLPYGKELHAITASLPAAVKERVCILPITSEIFKFYKAADIFVCTSKIESFPRITLEAMAFDLPIVTTPVFGIQEQVRRGVNALFYPPGDHGALAKALESLITDEGMRRRFSENSKYVLRQLETFDEMVAGYETLFKEAYLSLGPRARMPECIDIYRAKNSPRQSPIRKVSFLTSYKDENSQRFRVYNLIEELARHGVECAVIKEDCTGSLERVLDSDVLVAFRVVLSPNVRRVLNACGRAGVATVFDVDDLVFEPESADLLYGLSALGKADRIKAVRGLQRLRETLLACEYATCTTKALAGRIERLGKRCFVIPNTINRRQLELAREIRKSENRADDSRIRIGYFSGTKTHERDFMGVSDALYEVMEKNQRVEFHLVGILDLDPKFSAFGKRIIRQPLMGYLEMLRYLAGMDINLAPLEMNNIFAACKSELKIFESALLGIPTLASATESYAGCITDGVNGFLAGSKDEWVKKLEMITRDTALRRRIAGQAEQDFVKRYSIENVIADVIGSYAQIVSDRRIGNEGNAHYGR